MAPLATAAQGTGSLIIEGSATFPDATVGNALPLAVFFPETGGLGRLDAYVPQGILYLVEKRFIYTDNPTPLIPGVEAGTSIRSWPVKGATVSLVPGSHTGFLGFYTESGATVAFETLESFTMEPREVSSLGNPEAADSSDPGFMNYQQTVAEPHVMAAASGHLSYHGTGAMKVQGADVEVRSTNVTRHRTGMNQTGIAEITVTWIFIEFEEPARVFISGVPFELAAASASLEWNGVLRFVPREGSLRTSKGTYSPGPGSATLEGAFTATLVPAEGGRARLELVGELRASSMAYAPAAPVGPGKSGSWWPLLLLGAVVMGAVGGAAVALMPRRERVPFTAEDCAEAGAAACAEEDWARAAEWFERGLKLAPTSARLHADLGFCQSQLGDIESALLHFRKAHELSEDGEAAFNAATAAAFYDRRDEAADWLRLALARSPEHVLHLHDDDDLRALLDRPEVAEAEYWAREKMRARGHRFPDDDAEP